MSASFRRQLTVTASTKRKTISSTGQGTDVDVLTDILISEPSPVSGEIRNRPVLDTPNEVLMSFCDDGMDIQTGDRITLSDSINVTNKTYPVKFVERWVWTTGTTFKALFLEDLKT